MSSWMVLKPSFIINSSPYCFRSMSSWLVLKQIDNILSKYELKEGVIAFIKTEKQFYEDYKVTEVFKKNVL